MAAKTIEDIQRQAKVKALQSQAREREDSSVFGTALDVVESAFRGADDFVRAVASGITFGFADELAAGASTAIGGDFKSNLAKERARDKAISAPIRIGGEITGGIAGTLAFLPSSVLRGGGFLANVMKGGVIGGTEGAIAGAGFAEGGLAKRAKAAASGAALGGVLGIATPLAIHGGAAAARAAVSKAKSLTGRTAANRFQRRAARKIAEAMVRDQKTAPELAARAARQGPEGTLADAGGENLRALAGATALKAGPSKDLALRTLYKRQLGQAGRLRSIVSDTLDGRNFHETLDDVLTSRAAKARPLYKSALRHGNLNGPEIRALLGDEAPVRNIDIVIGGRTLTTSQTRALSRYEKLKDRPFLVFDPRVKRGFEGVFPTEKSAKEFIKNSKNKLLDYATPRDLERFNPTGQESPEFIRQSLEDILLQAKAVNKNIPSGTGIPSNKLLRRMIRAAKENSEELAGLPDTDIRVLDRVYKRLGPQVRAAKIKGESGSGAVAFELDEVRTKLKDAIVKEVPVYGEALETFSGDSALKDALEFGRKFLRDDAEITAKELARMTGGEREMFLTGASRAIIDKIDSSPDAADAAKKIFGTPAIREKLRAIFPNATEFRKFQVAVLREGRFADTQRQLLQGSQTAARQQSLQSLGEAPGVLSDITTGMAFEGPTGAVVAGLRRPISKIGGASRQTADEIGRMLLTPGRKTADDTLRLLLQEDLRRQATNTLGLAGAGGAGVLAGDIRR